MWAATPLPYAFAKLLTSQKRLKVTQHHPMTQAITWWGWHVPLAVQLLVVVLVTLSLIGVAVARFDRTE